MFGQRRHFRLHAYACKALSDFPSHFFRTLVSRQWAKRIHRPMVMYDLCFLGVCCFLRWESPPHSRTSLMQKRRQGHFAGDMEFQHPSGSRFAIPNGGSPFRSTLHSQGHVCLAGRTALAKEGRHAFVLDGGWIGRGCVEASIVRSCSSVQDIHSPWIHCLGITPF